jgi:uracil-DNA glycosylase
MKRVTVIGQAPPKTQSEQPFGRTRLYSWLSSVGMEKNEILDHFSFTALVSIFPGSNGRSHKAPNEKQIAADRPQLLAFLTEAHPEVIVPVGTLAIRECLCKQDLSLVDTVGHVFVQDPFGAFGQALPIIPLPHPSGASPWMHQSQNRQLLDSALRVLARELDLPI